MKSGDKSEKSEDKANKKPEEKKYKPVEFQFPFLLIRTKGGLRMLDRLGSLRVTPTIGWVLLIALPLIAIATIGLILWNLNLTISSPVLREFVRELGPRANLLIPGLNPLIPALGWVGLFVAIVVHE
ncbi:MAG: hypothetical protein O6762_05440, partial [Thaumarchaeota archaeon]|nr:hypothetical protein [Nitrososphaerota archaeon]